MLKKLGAIALLAANLAAHADTTTEQVYTTEASESWSFASDAGYFAGSISAFNALYDISGVTLSDGTDTYSWSSLTNAYGLETWTYGSSALSAGTWTITLTGTQNVAQSFAAATGSYTYTSATVSAVPEPQTYALFAAGLGMVGFLARRRSAPRRDRQ